MGHILGALGGLLIGLLVLSGAASGLFSGFSKSNVASMEENLIIMRMQTQQYFNGTNYDGLSNEVAIKAGIVPEAFIKGDQLRNTWGGDITLSPDVNSGTFSIEITNIPQVDCAQLARFQADAWAGVAVNGGEIDASDPTAVTNACGETNTITYTAR